MSEHTKSAEDRAREIANVRRSAGDGRFAEMVARHLREYARDQRRLCAEAIPGEGERMSVDPNPLQAHADALNDAHAAVMNAPEPGKAGK